MSGGRLGVFGSHDFLAQPLQSITQNCGLTERAGSDYDIESVRDLGAVKMVAAD